MALPKAVASSVKTPGFYLLVNLLGAPANPGTGALRAVIVGPKFSTGTIVNDTEVRQIFGPEDAATSHGRGSLVHLAAKALFAHYGVASVDVISPTPSAGAVATITHVIGGAPTSNMVIRYDVAGRTFDVPWNVGDAIGVHRAAAIAAINGDPDLMVTASAGGGAGDLVLTADGPGPWGNDVTVGGTIIAGGGGTITPGGAKLAGGTTEPNFTTALATLATKSYRLFVACLSNADAADATSSSNAHRLKTHIATFNSGLGAKLQIGVVGHTGAIADVKAGAIARNFEAMQYIYCQNAQSLPAEWAGAEAGDQLRWHSLRANYNRIGNAYADGALMRGAKNLVADALTAAELEDLQNNGVSPVAYQDGTNAPFTVNPITTHSLSGAAADYRCFFLSDVHGSYSFAEDLRTFIVQSFPNASITEDLPAGGDPLPPGVVERRDVDAAAKERAQTWVGLGVLHGPRLQTAIDNGDFAVEIDSGDESQVNIFIPHGIVKPLSKFSGYISKVA